MENTNDFLEEIKKRDYVNCTDGKPHDFQEQEVWVESDAMGSTDNGFWRHSKKCKNCTTDVSIRQKYCIGAKDKKHKWVESFPVSDTVISYNVRCEKCRIEYNKPVIIDGARIEMAKSIGTVELPNGSYWGILEDGIVKIFAQQKNFSCEFEINIERKFSIKPVKIVMQDKIASVYEVI